MTQPEPLSAPAPLAGFRPSLQGLRGVAALSVLGAHLYDMPLLAGFLPDLPALAHWICNLGGRGVEIFFVISGYVIAGSLARHRSVALFFYDRALRILPLYYFLNLVVFIIGPLIGYKFFKNLAPQDYLQILAANTLFVADAVSAPWAQQNAWTLAWEWAFYILFATAFYLGAVRWRLAAVAVVAFAAALAVVFPIAIFFFVGVLLRKYEARVAPFANFGIVVDLGCLAAIYVLISAVHPYAAVLPATVVFASALSGRSALARVLGAAPLHWAGDVSYSLYLTHPFVLFPLQIAGVKLARAGVDLWGLWLAFIAVGAPASLFVAAQAHRWIDVGLRRRLDRWIRSAVAGRALAGASRP